MKLNVVLFLLMVTIVSITGCKKKESTPDASTTSPQIVSLTANKYQIMVGGEDPAILTCEASGGNIQYTWEVDLGDIFPLNEVGSMVRFTGSDCCLGEKKIHCTVTNDKGSVSETIIITIFIP